MIYRKPNKEDAANILQYLKQVGSESDNLTFGKEGIPFTVEQEEEYLDKLTSPCIVAIDDEGKIVGDGGLELGVRRISHSAELCISVIKEYWGKGVGSTILELLIKEAKDRGVTKINLKVRADNQRAKGLYKKFGFVKEGYTTRMLKIGDEYFDGELWGLML